MCNWKYTFTSIIVLLLKNIQLKYLGFPCAAQQIPRSNIIPFCSLFEKYQYMVSYVKKCYEYNWVD